MWLREKRAIALSQGKEKIEKKGLDPESLVLYEFLLNEKMILELQYYQALEPSRKERIWVMIEFIDYFSKALSYGKVVVSEDKCRQLEMQISQLTVNETLF